jgi:hypothetical protein
MQILPTISRHGSTLALALVCGASIICLSPRAEAQAPDEAPLKPGFPLTVSGTGQGSEPVMADLGLSGGVKSLIFGTTSGLLHVVYLNSTASWVEAPGFPVTLPAPIDASPAVGVIDNSGKVSIVVPYGDPAAGSAGVGGVKAYHSNGILVWTHTSLNNQGAVLGSPAIADIDGDGQNEVVWGSTDFMIYAVNGATGANKTGWPILTRDTVRSSPALYDLDGDGRSWVIIGGDAHQEGNPAGPPSLINPYNTPDGGCLYVLKYDGTMRTGFPKCVDQVIVSSPSVGDIDGDGKPEIVHGTGTFWLGSGGGPRQNHSGIAPAQAIYAWHCDGTAVAGWPVTIIGQTSTSPALASLDGGPLDVVVTADNTMQPTNAATFHVYAFHGNGTRFAGFPAIPKDFFGVTFSAGEPTVADVLGTTPGARQILVPTNGSVAVFDTAGNLLTDPGTHPSGKFAFLTNASITGAAVGDLESDGAKIEVVAVSTMGTGHTTQVFVWNPVARSTPPLWGHFRHDPSRDGFAPNSGTCSGELACTAPPTTGLDLFTITPCRLVDTRNAAGSTNPIGGPAVSNGESRDFALVGNCTIPSGTVALSVNVTVVGATAPGDLTFSPGCQPLPVTTINFNAGETRANNAVLSLSSSGVLTGTAQLSGPGTVNVIIDVNGYFQ